MNFESFYKVVLSNKIISSIIVIFISFIIYNLINNFIVKKS